MLDTIKDEILAVFALRLLSFARIGTHWPNAWTKLVVDKSWVDAMGTFNGSPIDRRHLVPAEI